LFTPITVVSTPRERLLTQARNWKSGWMSGPPT